MLIKKGPYKSALIAAPRRLLRREVFIVKLEKFTSIAVCSIAAAAVDDCCGSCNSPNLSPNQSECRRNRSAFIRPEIIQVNQPAMVAKRSKSSCLKFK